MEPNPESEELRAQLQANHIGFVNAELNLVATLLEMSRAEYKMGFDEAAAKSLGHAWEAITGASRGLAHIESESQRAVFKGWLRELTIAIRNFEIPR
jgi:hypothetical protein